MGVEGKVRWPKRHLVTVILVGWEARGTCYVSTRVTLKLMAYYSTKTSLAPIPSTTVVLEPYDLFLLEEKFQEK